nr:uncharacterized protein LOC124807826 [Hydra vulgaris]XP_047126251.1 uncharacterized protein LOC124807826 [Hydra vulgaris]
METLEFTSSVETAADSDEKLSMPPAKKLAVCKTSDTEETYPSVSPRLKKSFNCQNILQPTTVPYIELFSSNRSLPIFSSSDQSLATVVAALGTRFAAFEKKSLELLVSIQYDLKKLNTRLINLEKGLVFPFVSNQSIAGPSPSVKWNYLPVKEEKDFLDLDEKLRNTYDELPCIGWRRRLQATYHGYLKTTNG